MPIPESPVAMKTFGSSPGFGPMKASPSMVSDLLHHREAVPCPLFEAGISLRLVVGLAGLMVLASDDKHIVARKLVLLLSPFLSG
jgi:hypothetical protein